MPKTTIIPATLMGQQANHPLPNGFQLEEYRIERQISLGGFSIVYLATDAKGKAVAIKEYLPNSLGLRQAGGICPVIPEENMGAFRYGMKCFFEEGRALAQLSHPNVIRVLNFFRANETVYMVMEYEHGHTLQQVIQMRKGQISERFIRGVFNRMLNGLREVHSHKLLHLDLKPSNIYLRAHNNTPVLIDFGAARQTLLNDKPMLKPMYTPGYASPEHYGARQDIGPWSDIYSVGASMYACLNGGGPPPADERLKAECLVPAVDRWAGQCSKELLDIIDWCLKLDHLERPQSVFSLQKSLVESFPTEEEKAPAENEGWFKRLMGTIGKPKS